MLLYFFDDLVGVFPSEEESLKVKAVIFDVDGTLINSIAPFHRMVVELFQRLKLTPPSREVVNDIIGNGESLLENFVPKHWKNRDLLIEKGQNLGYRLWKRFIKKELQPIPGSREVLEQIKRAPLAIGIVTSGSTDYVTLLQEKGFLPPMDVIVTKDDIPVLKPAPDPLLECLARLKMESTDCIYIGDAPVDIRAGKAAGIATVAVLTGAGSQESLSAEEPDHIIPDVSHLWKILDMHRE